MSLVLRTSFSKVWGSLFMTGITFPYIHQRLFMYQYTVAILVSGRKSMRLQTIKAQAEKSCCGQSVTMAGNTRIHLSQTFCTVTPWQSQSVMTDHLEFHYRSYGRTGSILHSRMKKKMMEVFNVCCTVRNKAQFLIFKHRSGTFWVTVDLLGTLYEHSV